MLIMLCLKIKIRYELLLHVQLISIEGFWRWSCLPLNGNLAQVSHRNFKLLKQLLRVYLITYTKVKETTLCFVGNQLPRTRNVHCVFPRRWQWQRQHMPDEHLAVKWLDEGCLSPMGCIVFTMVPRVSDIFSRWRLTLIHNSARSVDLF